jgi:hypothetical protein
MALVGYPNSALITFGPYEILDIYKKPLTQESTAV